MLKFNALASACALVALPTLGFAQSSVTLYGILDIAVTSQNLGDGSATTVQGGGVPSRFGLRGAEDLGGGVSATFSLESELNLNNGSGSGANGSINFQRMATLGLKGKFGDFQVGRSYTPAFLATREHDALSFAYYNSLLIYTIPGGATTRYSNGVFYVSPNLGGLTVRTAYSFGDGSQTNSSIGKNFGIAGIYKNGGLVLDAYYQRDKVAVGGSGSTTVKSHKMLGFGGSYKFRSAQVMMGYGQNSTSSLENKTRSFNIGVVVPVGRGEVIGQVTRLKTDAAFGQSPAATAWGLTYRYFLSKRTTLYATGGKTHNNSTGQFLLTGVAPHAPKYRGASPHGIGFGIQHNF